MSQRNFSLFGFLGTTFVVLCAYLFGIAPGVTMEDSGELITAAYTWGVPHPPGYPLFTIINGVLLRIVTFWEPAFVTNLSSAVFSSLAAGVLFLSFKRISKSFLFAFAVSVLISCLPHYYRQSVITEVYGLNNFLCAFLIYMLTMSYPKPNSKWFFVTGLIFGLALSNHHTSLVFGFMLIPVVLFSPLKGVVSKIFVGLTGTVLGLTPYLYLATASFRTAIFNWGQIEDWESFWFVVSRQQYSPSLTRPWSFLIEQLREYLILFMNNLTVVGVVLVVFAIGYLMNFSRKKTDWYWILLFLLTGPVTCVLINFVVAVWSEKYYLETSRLMSVFFLSNYVAAGILVNALYRRLGREPKIQVALLSLVVFSVPIVALTSMERETMRGHDIAEGFLSNLEALSDGKPTLVFTNWDPFTFPFIYLQDVKGKAKNIAFVDVEILKGPWYVRYLQSKYPWLTDPAGAEIEEFLSTPKSYLDFNAFKAMIEKFVETVIQEGDVYILSYGFLYPVPYQFFSEFELVPGGLGLRVKNDGADFPIEKMDFAYLENANDNWQFGNIFRDFVSENLLRSAAKEGDPKRKEKMELQAEKIMNADTIARRQERKSP